MPVAILFYDVVLAVHVAAIVVAFGVVFAYPVAYSYVRSNHAGSLNLWHGMQAEIGKKIITPAGTVAFLAGVYLATDRDLWSKVWVTIPMLILIAVMGLGGAYFGPTETRLAKADTTTEEYRATASRLFQLQLLAGALVLVAVFFMAVKPGGY